MIPDMTTLALSNVWLVRSRYVFAMTQGQLISLFITNYSHEWTLGIEKFDSITDIGYMTYALTFWLRSVICFTSSSKLIEFTFFLIIGVLEKHLEIPFDRHLFFKLVSLTYIWLINEFFVHVENTVAMGCFSELIIVFTFQNSGCAYFTNIAHLIRIWYFINFISINIFTKLDAHIGWPTHLVDIRIAHGAYGMDKFLLFFGAENKFLHISIINLTLPATDCFIIIVLSLSILTHVTLKDIITFPFDSDFLDMSIFS